MADTTTLLQQLDAQAEATKGPLRSRHQALSQQIEALRAPEAAKKAERDRTIDSLTRAQDAALSEEIRSLRKQAEDLGVLALEAEAAEIRRALKDRDGRLRLA